MELAEAEELVTHAIHPYTRSLLSAIPMPNPRRERKKKLLVYDPAMHDYPAKRPQWRELRPNHLVLCSAAEAEQWSKRKSEPIGFPQFFIQSSPFVFFDFCMGLNYNSTGKYCTALF